jgi:hypothetical protein
MNLNYSAIFLEKFKDELEKIKKLEADCIDAYEDNEIRSEILNDVQSLKIELEEFLNHFK